MPLAFCGSLHPRPLTFRDLWLLTMDAEQSCRPVPSSSLDEDPAHERWEGWLPLSRGQLRGWPRTPLSSAQDHLKELPLYCSPEPLLSECRTLPVFGNLTNRVAHGVAVRAASEEARAQGQSPRYVMKNARLGFCGSSPAPYRDYGPQRLSPPTS